MPQLVGNYEKCIVGIATTGKSDKIPALARATRSYESKSWEKSGTPFIASESRLAVSAKQEAEKELDRHFSLAE